MHRWRITYSETYRPGPLSFWVHRHLDNDVWQQATRFAPPLPGAIPGKGYPMLHVDAPGTELIFASIEEVEHFLEVIRQKNMPTSRQLSNLRNAGHGPNAHWLSRLPADLKAWRKRERLIPVVENGLGRLRQIYGY